jgi:adenylate cyclase
VDSVRRLAAIMFTDTVGYTASSQANEGRTLDLLRQQEELVRPLFGVHHGREIKSTGDGFMVEFDSALKATQCAVNIQRRIFERNAEGGLAPIQIRIGVHLGDVVERGTDIVGDAVNIAARIEPIAEPGGICVSGAVYEQIRNKIPDKLEKLPPTSLKGLELPIDIYRVVLPWNLREPANEPSAPTSLDKSRIAVLPFVNISSDPGDDFFVDGLTEELIANLALVKGLKVIARTSVMNYKKKEKNISQIGKELGVGTIVEGSVRKAANRIRVTVQVIDVATEEHLWASSYNDSLDDVFAVQSDIATKVTASLPSNLANANAAAPVLEKSQDISAYMLFLQGQALVWHPESEHIQQALRCFQQAVERDPTFARAHAGVAQAYIRLGEQGALSWSESIELGRAAAERALSISPNLAEAHSLLARFCFMSDDLVPGAEERSRRALELNPNLAEAHVTRGATLGFLGDLPAYVSHMETAYRLDPLSPNTIGRLGRAYFHAGRMVEARDHWNKTVGRDPYDAHRGTSELFIAEGNLAQASSSVREMEVIGPTNTATYFMKGYLAALQGDRATALEMVSKLDPANTMGTTNANFAGYIYLGLGDTDRFFDYLDAAAQGHVLQIVELRYHPIFAGVRQDPRFEHTFGKVNLKLQPAT